ncbi:MAG: flagellar basal-body rod protein FlgG [Planctomycetes bacterium]|nr:flagellar basal-body rod protein FlgG [Planctomycetota bacterium]
MLKALFTAASGMKVQQTNVDMISNNLANVNTSGFKRSQANFEDLIYITEQRPGFSSGGTGSSMGIQVGSGARLVSTAKIFSQGVLQQTKRDLDVAIMGDGFFEVQLPDGTRAYTRDGSLQLDAQQRLVTSDGYQITPAVSLGGGPYDGYTIATGGEVVGHRGDESTNLGTITLVTFLNPAGLESVGSNLFRQTSSSGPATTGQVPGQNGVGELQSQFLERSNVEVVNELVALIIAQRAYEVNSKAIKTGDDMLALANNLST